MNKRWSLSITILGIVLMAGLGFALANKNDEPDTTTPNTPVTQQSGLVTDSPWLWQDAKYGGGKTITASIPDSFILVFDKDGSFTSTSDCNSLGGKYKVDGDSLKLTDIVSTLSFCANSQEAEYIAILQDTMAYSINSDGNLELQFNTDSDIATFLKQ